jgi:hypothetical protein
VYIYVNIHVCNIYIWTYIYSLYTCIYILIYTSTYISGIDISAFIPKSTDDLDEMANDPTLVTGMCYIYVYLYVYVSLCVYV